MCRTVVEQHSVIGHESPNQHVFVAVSIDIAHCQGFGDAVFQFAKLLELSSSVVQPDNARCASPGDDSIEVSVIVEVFEFDIRSAQTFQLLPLRKIAETIVEPDLIWVSIRKVGDEHVDVAVVVDIPGGNCVGRRNSQLLAAVRQCLTVSNGQVSDSGIVPSGRNRRAVQMS